MIISEILSHSDDRVIWMLPSLNEVNVLLQNKYVYKPQKENLCFSNQHYLHWYVTGKKHRPDCDSISPLARYYKP